MKIWKNVKLNGKMSQTGSLLAGSSVYVSRDFTFASKLRQSR